MATFDEKLLDGPAVGYCSSSEEEDNEGNVIAEGGLPCSSVGEDVNALNGSPRTGPKGVLADFERFRRQKSAKAALEEAKFLEAANRFSLSHKPTTECGEEDELERIRNRRVQQLKNMAKGRILEVPSRLDFLTLIENESCNGSLLFIHIYCDSHEQSVRLNEALLELAGRLADTAAERTTKITAKFYKVQAKVLGTSENFALNALPTLQVYSDEQLIGNFIRLSADLGDDYDGGELYKFLLRHGIPLELGAK